MKKKNIIIIIIILIIAGIGITKFVLPNQNDSAIVFNPKQEKQSNQIEVSLTIDQRMLNNLKKENKLDDKLTKYVDDSGYLTNDLKVYVKKNQTIADIITAYTKQNKISLEIQKVAGTAYVASLNNFAGKTTGPMSGWLYLVNNIMPLKSIEDYKLKDGDKIIFVYSNDGGSDIKKNINYSYEQ